MNVTAEQVVAYRVAEQGLGRESTSLLDLAVLDIGVQDSGSRTGMLAFDARLAEPPTMAFGPTEPIALGWTLRGAPHLHRRTDLNNLAGALWPLSDADAAVRLGETGKSMAALGLDGLEAFALAVDAMRGAVGTPSGKGVVSAAMTRALPDAWARDCRGCKSRHISDPTMRLAALPAGVEFEPDTAPPVLVKRAKARTVKRTDRAALQALILGYLRLLGPATPGNVAGYLDARRADIETVWPDGLTQVEVDGRASWLPADRVDALAAAAKPELVRLFNPFDPYLQARDRDVIVPDRSVHKQLWPVLGRPGVVFVDGAVVGTWRTKSSGTKLTINVESFVPLPPTVRKTIEHEAQRVGTVRGATAVNVQLAS